MKRILVVVWLFSWCQVMAQEGWHNIATNRLLRSPAKEYWRAPFLDGETAFLVERHDGAAGEVSFSNGVMSVHKTNAAGYLLIKSRNGFSLPVGTRLRSYADSEVTGSDPNYSLAFPRVLDSRGRLHACFELDAAGVFMGGGEKIAFLANTPPGVAERRFSHFRVLEEGGTKLVPALVVAGAPSKSRWVRWGVEDYDAADAAWAKIRSGYVSDGSGKTNLEDSAVFARRLAADIEHVARIDSNGGRLIVDGRVDLPVLYKNPGSWGTNWGDYNGRAMFREGIRLQDFQVGMDRHWTNGEWDVDATVADIRDQMRVSPDALVMLSFFCSAPKEYAEKHMDEVARNPFGAPYVGDWEKMKSRHHTDPNQKPYSEGCWPWVSMSSKVYCRYLEGVMARLVARLKKEGLSKRIIGIHFCGWHDGQFAPYRADYSAPAKAGFGEYLIEKYGRLPVPYELPVPSADKFFSDPATESGRYEHDFNDYLHLAPFRFQERLARQAKKCFGKDIVCIHWCMGAFGGEMNCSYYFDEFFKSDVMDGLVAQPSYIRRLPGNSIGSLMPLASFARHGKLYVDELDLRAWGEIPGYVNEASLGGLGFAMDLPEWQAVNRKMTGRMIAAKQGYWYYDISGGFYNPDPIENEIGSAVAVYRGLFSSSDDPWHPSVAFVVDAKGLLWRNLIGRRKHADGLGEIDTQLEILAASGVPFEVMTFADAESNPDLLDGRKLFVFAGFYDMDASRRRFLSRILANNAKVIVLAGTGGFRNKVRKPGSDCYVQSVLSENECDYLSRYHAEWTRWALGVEGGVAEEFRPLSFTFEEREGTQVLARYRDGEPAVIRRGNVVAIGQSAGLTPALLNRLAFESGGYVPTRKRGLQVDMNGSFVSVNALDNGVWHFKLPYRCKVLNLKTRKEVPVSGNVIRLDMTAGETRWYRLRRE